MRKCNLNQAPCHEACGNFAVFDSLRSPAHRCSRCAFSISLVPLQPCRATRRIITSSSSHRPPHSFSFPVLLCTPLLLPLFAPEFAGTHARTNSGSPSRCSLFAEVARVTLFIHIHTRDRIKCVYICIYIYVIYNYCNNIVKLEALSSVRLLLQLQLTALARSLRLTFSATLHVALPLDSVRDHTLALPRDRLMSHLSQSTRARAHHAPRLLSPLETAGRQRHRVRSHKLPSRVACSHCTSIT